MTAPKRILIIRLSALGDFVQSLGPFAAIRAHHPAARITLLTTKPFVDLARASPYFDDIWVDSRPRAWELAALMRLRRKLRSAGFDMVYDLQTSERSSSYFHLMGRPRWSGIADGCAFPHDNPDRDHLHTLDRQAEQLAMAGIAATPPPDLSWAEADLGRFGLPARFVVLVPGGAPHRPSKRWPAAHFAAVAERLAAIGLATVLLGTEADSDAVEPILAAWPHAVSLVGRTGFVEIAALGRSAVAALGNDTGPMHLLAAAGSRCIVLFSAESEPALCAPRGQVTILRRDDLAELMVEPVWENLHAQVVGNISVI